MVFLNMLGIVAFAFLVVACMGLILRVAEWVNEKISASFRDRRK